jgi:hypothetical protein
MKKILGLALAVACASVTSLPAQQGSPAQQGVNGTISDSMCGASHQARAGGLSDRTCVFECIKGLAKYVLVVEGSNQVIQIRNQDFAGFPLYANRRIRLTGELNGDVMLVSKLEPIPSHVHMGHLMTNWKDTPGTAGLLTTAINEARIAVVHAKLAAGVSGDLDQMKLHAGHVLHALDPTVETTGPGTGYGVKKATTGSLQHVGFAAKSEGASANVTLHTTHVSASLNDVLQWTDQAIAVAQKIRAATSASEAAPLASELAVLAARIAEGTDANQDGQIGWQTGEGGLQQAQAHMFLMKKGEGL